MMLSLFTCGQAVYAVNSWMLPGATRCFKASSQPGQVRI